MENRAYNTVRIKRLIKKKLKHFAVKSVGSKAADIFRLPGARHIPHDLVHNLVSQELTRDRPSSRGDVTSRSHETCAQQGGSCCAGDKLAALGPDANVSEKHQDVVTQSQGDVAGHVTLSTAISTNHTPQTVAAATLTDVCYHEDVDEVDLVSLIEEQIPRYVLRADTVTDFAGYENADWIHTPVLPVDLDLDLSPDLIEETLKYFTLCAERVSQMTRAYSDVTAVTRLLEEKERDVELAARIGQQLLERNRHLETQRDELERAHDAAVERLKQLQHDVTLKDALLQVYTNESDPETPLSEAVPYAVGQHDMDTLSRRMRTLEEENSRLRVETTSLQNTTTTLEAKEQDLVKDIVRQLGDANSQVKQLQSDVSCKSDVALKQQEEITDLVTKNMALENRLKKITIENAEYIEHLKAAQDAQRELTAEIAGLTERYQEVVSMLTAAQEELKGLRHREAVSVVRHAWYTPRPPEGSLALELEDSLRRDQSDAESVSHTHRAAKVMDTVRSVNKQLSRRGERSPSNSHALCDRWLSGSHSPSNLSDTESALQDGYQGDVDSSYGSMAASRVGLATPTTGTDIEVALRRLTTRRANEINERRFEAEQKAKVARSYGDQAPGAQTPDSCFTETFSDLSPLSDHVTRSGLQRGRQKLQIVKPLEGSLTLGHWQRLATPHLAGILDTRYGVTVKGTDPEVEPPQEVFHLSDLEEDEVHVHGKTFDLNQSTFTFTDSLVKYPDGSSTPQTDHRQPSASRVTVTSTLTPTRSKHDGADTSTFSMYSDVAVKLNERYQDDVIRSLCSPPRRGPHCSDGHVQQSDVTRPSLVSRVKALGLTGVCQRGGVSGQQLYSGLNNILTITTRSGPFPAADTLRSGENPPRVETAGAAVRLPLETLKTLSTSAPSLMTSSSHDVMLGLNCRQPDGVVARTVNTSKPK